MPNAKVAFILAALLAGCAADADQAIESGTGGSGGKADGSAGFLASLPGWGRYIVLDKLDEIVPVYLAETQAVLARIDALPAGTVAGSTALDEVPIPDLFAAGDATLRQVLDDSDFAGGRTDHDVAWLRQSAVELAAMETAVTQLIASGTSPASFDDHLTNQAYSHPTNGTVEITAGIRAVSRFYCNLDIRIEDDGATGFTVGAVESCD